MLSDFQRKKLTKLFNFFDSNGNQTIEHKDIFEICQNFTKEYEWETGGDQELAFRAVFLDVWKKMISLADTNVDNKVSLDEFLVSYEKSLSTTEGYEKLVLPFIENLFFVVAKGKDTISIFDFIKLYKAFRNSEESALAAFEKMDVNSDGFVSREELLELYYQFHYSQDVNTPGNVFFGPLE